MKRTYALQPGQPGEGPQYAYNVHKPLPYPIFVDGETGAAVQGRVAIGVLVGFTSADDLYDVQLDFRDFTEEPQKAEMMCPVLSKEGLFHTISTPITRVREV